MSALRRELGRKAFHMLSLVYLAAYHFFGFPRVLALLGGWLAFVALVETGRLCSERLNLGLSWLFRGVIRPDEGRRYSGIFHTTAGCFLTMLMVGRHPRVVAAALLILAFGDAAAALAGRAFGRHRLLGGEKSWEGSLACYGVCVLAGFSAGLKAPAALLGAFAATVVEALPTNRFLNDNLWMPLSAAAAILSCGGA